jgi:hypothetical protein
MGMYDDVVIEGLKLKTSKEVASFLKANNAELPSHFQTKDLNNSLTQYTIKENGQVYERVFVPTGKKKSYELPFANWIDNRSFLEKLYYKTKNVKLSNKDRLVDVTKPVLKKINLTSTFEIHSYDVINGRYLSLSYDIITKNGKVSSVKLNEWDIESEKAAAKRRLNDEEFKKNMEISFSVRKKLQSKWYYPILKETVNPCIFFSRLLVQKLCSKIVTWSYRWHGV